MAASNASRQHDDDCVAGSAGVATADHVGHHGWPTGDERALDRAGAQPVPDHDAFTGLTRDGDADWEDVQTAT
ncbi:MAG: hypothetical protein ACK6CU_07535 [Deltaproteobacteria bacterium]